MKERTSLSIHKLAEEDRPREKLLAKGRQSLTESELIAIILGSGNARQNAVELARSILASANNDLNELAKYTVSDLMKFDGIGEAKAISIVSCLELGRRRDRMRSDKVQITCSQDVYQCIKPELIDLNHEEFWVLFLNRANHVLRKEKISSGGITGTVVDVRLIFSKALSHQACSIILVHNHPSGNLKPSSEDQRITSRIKDAGLLLEIAVLDHVIYTDQGFYSFADEGML